MTCGRLRSTPASTKDKRFASGNVCITDVKLIKEWSITNIFTLSYRTTPGVATNDFATPLFWCLHDPPLFTLFFMATIFGNGQMENIPIGIVDQDNTATSRSIIRNISAVSDF